MMRINMGIIFAGIKEIVRVFILSIFIVPTLVIASDSCDFSKLQLSLIDSLEGKTNYYLNRIKTQCIPFIISERNIDNYTKMKGLYVVEHCIKELTEKADKQCKLFVNSCEKPESFDDLKLINIENKCKKKNQKITMPRENHEIITPPKEIEDKGFSTIKKDEIAIIKAISKAENKADEALENKAAADSATFETQKNKIATENSVKLAEERKIVADTKAKKELADEDAAIDRAEVEKLDKEAIEEGVVVKSLTLLQEEQGEAIITDSKKCTTGATVALGEPLKNNFIYISSGDYSENLENISSISKKRYLKDFAKKTDIKRLNIDLGFIIQTNEVSIAEFMKFPSDDQHYSDFIDNNYCDDIPWLTSSLGKQLPATCLLPQNIFKYIEWLNTKEPSHKFALPTAKQWLVAAVLYGENKPFLEAKKPKNIDTSSKVINLLGNSSELSATTNLDSEYYLQGKSFAAPQGDTGFGYDRETFHLGTISKNASRHYIGFRLVAISKQEEPCVLQATEH